MRLEPMRLELDRASSCGALTASANCWRCHAHAMANGRCRWHGGESPDPPNRIENDTSESTHADEVTPGGETASRAQSDEHSGGAIARERDRGAREIDHAVQYSARSSEIGKWAPLGVVVVFAAVGGFIIGSNLWSSNSRASVSPTKTSQSPLSPAPQSLAMQASPRGVGDEVLLSPSVRGPGNELLTSSLPVVPQPEFGPPVEPAPVVVDIPVPAVTTTAKTPDPGTATYQLGGYAPRQLDRDEVAMLAKRGEAFIAAGDIAAARLVLQRAAEARDARAALLLGATYDPIMLDQMRARGFAPDIAIARIWYERAKEFGSAEASQRLEMLASLQRRSSEQLGKTERQEIGRR
jgi:hypothetical protein